MAKDQSSGITRWSDLENDLYLLPKNEGWIVPNDFNILLDLVIQSTCGESGEVWMLSGPDMIQYLPETHRIKELQIGYEAVSQKLGLRKEIEINLVPFTQFHFVVRREHAKVLDALLEMQASGAPRQQLKESATNCPDLWAKTEKRSYFSQHDMSNANDLYAPEELFSSPLSQIEGRFVAIKSALS